MSTATQPSARDRVLGALTGTRLASAAARPSSPLPGAEATLQLLLMDGLLEALEWAERGQGAEDTACLWLGGLRWVAAVDGALPDAAPEPPARPIASAVADAIADGAIAATQGAGTQGAGAHGADSASTSAERVSGGDPQNLTGLRSPEMSQPNRPFNRPAATVPELASTDGPGVLARAVAVGLLAPAQEADIRRLATAAAALSHGAPSAHVAAADAALVIHAVPRGVWAVRGTLSEALGREHATDSPSRQALQCALGAVGTVLEDLEHGRTEAAWKTVTRLAQEKGEGAALYAGALVGAVVGAEALASVTSTSTTTGSAGTSSTDPLEPVTDDLATRFAALIA